MPFMLAHPAVVVPIWRRLGRYGILSALVIGSLIPDFHYFLPFDVTRVESHSLSGLFWYCLPVGFVAYLVFHLFIKYPLVSLLPNSVVGRLMPFVTGNSRLPEGPPLAVILSIILGAASHLAWDGFTHGDGFAVEAFSFFQVLLFSVEDYPVHVYQVLQLASTFLGMGLLAWWIWRWLRSAPIYPIDTLAKPFGFSPVLSPVGRKVILVVMLGISALPVLLPALVMLFAPVNIWIVRGMIKSGVLAATSTLGLEILAFCTVWQVLALCCRWRCRCGGTDKEKIFVS